MLVDIDAAGAASTGAAAFRLHIDPPVTDDFHHPPFFERLELMRGALLLIDHDFMNRRCELTICVERS